MRACSSSSSSEAMASSIFSAGSIVQVSQRRIRAGPRTNGSLAPRRVIDRLHDIPCRRHEQRIGGFAGKHVLLHSLTIVHDFGVRVWLRSCKAVLTNRKIIFLELMWLA